MQVEKGDYLSMEAKPDSAEKDFWTSLDVVEGTASIKHVENSTAQEYSYGRSYFDNLDDGYTTLRDINSSTGGSWEVWAESNVLLEVTVGDSDRNADIPYSWSIESTYHKANTTDNWPDDVEKASRVNPTGSYTGNLSTPNDEDTFLYQLTDGQNISMQTRFPTAEQDAFVSLDVREGSASLHNLSNAKAQTSSRWGDTYFDDLTDGHSTISDFTHSAPASWRVQAESNAILAVTVSESNRNAPVYEWTLQSKLNGTITPPEAPQVSVSVDQTTPSVGEPVTLQATAPNSDTTTYTWDTNSDGSTDATGATTTQQFTEPGQHTVSVTAENAGGSDTAAIILDVQPEPTADLSISTAGDEATPGETVTATATIENNGTIATGIKLNVTAQPNWTITNSSSAGGIWSESNTTLTWDSLEPGTEVSPSMTLQVPSNTTSGEYHLTAMATATENATISKDASTKLTVINESQNPPAIVADRTPIDPDKDGVYEDVNGDGRLTVGDVQALFANLDKASQNPTGYDMNGDGRVTTGDVQALFASL
jgi:PKD repeat protein